MKKISVLFFLALIFLSITDVSAQWDTIINVVTGIVCGIYDVFWAIAGGIASLIFVIAGVKWVASENDPGSRKAAKDAMVHALVGLIIVGVAYLVVGAVGLGSCGAGAI